MRVICGNEFQPSLRDVVYSHCIPNAEALGYCPPVPPGRDSGRGSSWIQAGIGKTSTPLVSAQEDYSFVTHRCELTGEFETISASSFQFKT